MPARSQQTPIVGSWPKASIPSVPVVAPPPPALLQAPIRLTPAMKSNQPPTKTGCAFMVLIPSPLISAVSAISAFMAFSPLVHLKTSSTTSTSASNRLLTWVPVATAVPVRAVHPLRSISVSTAKCRRPPPSL